jgi:CRP-like cAMP-binding protein
MQYGRQALDVLASKGKRPKGTTAPKPGPLRDNREIIKSLMKIPALNTLEENEIKELLDLKEIREFEPGELIVKEGSLAGRIYYLITGKVKITKRSKVLMTLQRVGDVFGEMAFLEGKASTASVYAVDKVVCLAIDVSDIARFSDISRLALHYLIYRELSEEMATRLNLTGKELAKTREKLEWYEKRYPRHRSA